MKVNNSGIIGKGWKMTLDTGLYEYLKKCDEERRNLY